MIAHHRWIDARRAADRSVPRADRSIEESDRLAPSGPAGSAENEALEAIDDAELRRWIADLVPDQRDVLLLRLFADLTIEQIATATSRSSGAAKALQRRGLVHLSARVAERTAQDSSDEAVPLSDDSTVMWMP